MEHGQILHLSNTYNSVAVNRIYTRKDYDQMTFKQSNIFLEHFEYWTSQADSKVEFVEIFGDDFTDCLEQSFQNFLDYRNEQIFLNATKRCKS